MVEALCTISIKRKMFQIATLQTILDEVNTQALKNANYKKRLKSFMIILVDSHFIFEFYKNFGCSKISDCKNGNIFGPTVFKFVWV